MAKCKPIDEQAREALRKLGFTIDDDGQGAKITGEISIST
jgi:hypothetical protein